MTKARVYLDSCCFIELLKGERGMPLDHPDDLDMIKRLLKASRDDAVECWTSMMAVAEVLGVEKGEVPDASLQQRIERLLLSGHDGIFLEGLTPNVVTSARDLYWKKGLRERAADRIHVATAIDLKCDEILSVDGRLEKRFNRSAIGNCPLRAARDSRSLPDEYRQNELLDR